MFLDTSGLEVDLLLSEMKGRYQEIKRDAITLCSGRKSCKKRAQTVGAHEATSASSLPRNIALESFPDGLSIPQSTVLFKSLS